MFQYKKLFSSFQVTENITNGQRSLVSFHQKLILSVLWGEIERLGIYACPKADTYLYFAVLSFSV